MPTEGLSDEQIKHMVDRFLSWRLPENFRPDAGISFKAEFNENTPWPMKHEPVGTNLFSADQAAQMVRYMAEGLPRAEGPAPPGGGVPDHSSVGFCAEAQSPSPTDGPVLRDGGAE